MNRDNTVKWKDIYHIWQAAVRKYPELQNLPLYRSVAFSEPRFGPCFYFNWIKKEEEEKAIREDLAALASSWPEVGMNWSRGTVKTAGLLAFCETEEEAAAVWICAFALFLDRRGGGRNTTTGNAYLLEREACGVFARKRGYWHTSSRDFFPDCYIPEGLLWERETLSVSTLVELAAINAAMVMTHYTPVEYKMATK